MSWRMCNGQHWLLTWQKEGSSRVALPCVANRQCQARQPRSQLHSTFQFLSLVKTPGKGRVVTLGQKQKWHIINGSSVKDKIKFARYSELDGLDVSGPNIVSVFDEILRVATEGKLPAEKMVKRVFIFSDRQFQRDQSSPDEITDYEVICKMFEESGYGSVMPEIVFWNLGSSNCTPVLGKQNGVALLSGYSKNLLKLFLEMDGDITPEVVMDAAISGVEYQNLKVID